VKKRIINEILKQIESIGLLEAVKNDTLFFTSDSNSELTKGVRISESRFSLTMSLWLLPAVHFKGFNLATFESYEVITLDGSIGELTWSKNGYSDKKIVEEVVCSILVNLQTIASLKDLNVLQNFLKKNRENWLVSVYAKAQYALLLFNSGDTAEAIKIYSKIVQEMNVSNPISKECFKLFDFLSSGDENSAKHYLNTLTNINRDLIAQKLNSIAGLK